MELSLQRKVNLSKVWLRRQQFIKDENLHIDDMISYEQFEEFYKKYGHGITDIEFARYFLDLNYEKLYKLKVKKMKQTRILSREPFSRAEILKLREEIINLYDLELDGECNYKDVLKMYSKFGGKLSLYIFAEEVLDIPKHNMETAKSVENKTGRSNQIKVLKSVNTDRTEIIKAKNRVLKESGKHIDDKITLKEFEELYNKFGKNLNKKVFAKKVLEISDGQINRFLRGGATYTTIFNRLFIKPSDVCKLREKVILEENLHIEDKISLEDFEKLYKKYGKVLSKEMFAEEILDVSIISFRNIKKCNQNPLILKNIEIKKGYINLLRRKIIDENSFVQNQMISKKQFLELYEKYGYILSERQFATLILDTSIDSYRSLKCDANKEMSILRNERVVNYKELRKRVILENHLIYSQKIGYSEFSKLHKKYASKSEEYIFAIKVLGIPQTSFNNIRFDKENTKTQILLDEKLPSDKEIEEIKKKVILENKLHRKDQIDFEKFNELHLKYGGIMPDDMFAQRILDISSAQLNRIRPSHKKGLDIETINKEKKKRKVEILLHTFMTEEEIENLRKQIIEDNILYPKRPVTMDEFKKIYNQYNHILSHNEFAKMILGVNRQNLKKLKRGDTESLYVLYGVEEKGEKSHLRKEKFSDNEIELLKRYLLEDLTDEEIACKFSVTLHFLKKNINSIFAREAYLKDEEIYNILYRRVKNLLSNRKKVSEIQKDIDIDNKMLMKIISKIKTEPSLEKKSIKILDDYKYNEKNTAIVYNYLDECKKKFKEGKFEKEKLDLVEECIEFVQAGAKEIEFFTKVCISFSEYERANRIINNNIDNDSVTLKERFDLRSLQDSVKYAIRKENAVNMIYEQGITDIEVIQKYTGISEIDILELLKNAKNGNNKKKKDSLDEPSR